MSRKKKERKMKISFNFEWSIDDLFRSIKSSWNTYQCKKKGHIWKKHKKEDGFWPDPLWLMYVKNNMGEKTHVCLRCGEGKYKKPKKDQKIKFRKYKKSKAK